MTYAPELEPQRRQPAEQRSFLFQRLGRDRADLRMERGVYCRALGVRVRVGGRKPLTSGSAGATRSRLA